jgi:hypothetical protein
MHVVAPATASELNRCRPKSQRPWLSLCETNAQKFAPVISAGIGFGDESNAWPGDSAIFSTQSTG